MYAAVMVTGVAVPTALVLTEKVAVVAAARTVTLAATDPAALSLLRVTTAPPAGAWPVKVTVAVEDCPPVRLAGFRLTEDTAAGLIVRVAVCVPL